MNKNSPVDSILYYSAKALSIFFCRMPLSVCLWLARRVGDLAYLFYRKRGAVAYVNLKHCFGQTLSPKELLRLERKAFQNLMQTAVEILRIPSFNQKTVERLIRFDHLERIGEELKKGKGVIVLTAHFGNWEYSSLASAFRGYVTMALAREQKFPKVNGLLNQFRSATGCQVIQKGFPLRQALKRLRENGIVGILTDQDAGKGSVFVPFFGRQTSFAPGAIDLALRTGCTVLPCFIRREKTSHHVIHVTEPLQIPEAGSDEEKIREGLRQFAQRLESYIRKYPDQWLWLHKRWKSSPDKSLALLSDGKAGHLEQLKGAACAWEKGLLSKGKGPIRQTLIPVEFKSRWHRMLLTLFSLQAAPVCQGCMRCVRFCLKPGSYQVLLAKRYEGVLSCGSQAASVNRLLTRENRAKSVVVMDPVLPPASAFDLAIIAQHDRPRGKNIFVTQGTLHRIEPENLEEAGRRLEKKLGASNRIKLGCLIGGDTDGYMLSPSLMEKVIDQMNRAAAFIGGELLVTTSRRTPPAVEQLLRQRWGHDPRCRLLVIANESNPEGILQEILGLSSCVVVTGESMSMVSEAAASGRYVFVFLPERKKTETKLDRAVETFARDGYLTLCSPEELCDRILSVWERQPPRKVLRESVRLQQVLGDLL